VVAGLLVSAGGEVVVGGTRLCKPCATQFTGIGTLAAVGAAMPPEGGNIRETTATARASMRFLPGVRSNVELKVVGPRKRLRAHCTLVRSFSRMHSHVYLEIIWLSKHSAADITCGAIRLGNLVSSLLCHRLILTLQGRLSAIFRLIDLVIGCKVPLQLTLPLKRLGTLITGKGRCRLVAFDVPLPRTAVPEADTALGTDMLDLRMDIPVVSSKSRRI